ncbi:MAG: aromatic aminobenezylarsenical efflux permease ArsG family transporter [Pseudomonadota bacterium]
MDSFYFGAAMALWLGILTSISPCPLATNITAISFIGKQLGSPYQVLVSGLFYTIGRMVTYFGLSIFLVAGLLSIPELSGFLQKYMNKLLGPLLILVGMFLLELLQFGFFSGPAASEKMRARAGRAGIWGAGFLGIVFALSFCPVSAALFFGSLIPLSVKHQSSFVLPSLYGIGTGLPVSVFAVLLAFGARSVAAAFNRLTKVEWWIRRITGVIFILVGVYYSFTYVFGMVW